MSIRNTLLGGASNWATNELVIDTDLNDTFTGIYTNLLTTYGDAKTNGYQNVPIGTILPWLKSLTGTPTLPSGWKECDGTNGTPNLNSTNVFLRGTSAATGGTGGASSHAHGLATQTYGGNTTAWATSPTSTSSNVPPYYTVVFIMKVGI